MKHTLRPKTMGIILGVLYGLTLRLLWEMDVASDVGGLVTISFMFLVPVVIGYIRIHYEFKTTDKLSTRQLIVLPWQPIFVFVLTTVITLLEGSICVVMALPAFMFFASLGGFIAAHVNAFLTERRNGTLLSIAVLPILIAPVEVNFLHLSKTYEVSNDIVIDASPHQVWRELANVREINQHEWPFSFTSLIGVPRPLEANMSALGAGALRTSIWEKGVTFNEVITQWQPGEKMTYRFDIDTDLIPNNAMDKHVKLGGEYFSPLRGGYYLSSNEQGQTVLTLKTTLLDNTNFGIYSRVWGEIIFSDFHRSLLRLMKNRAENHTALSNELSTSLTE